MTDEMRKSYALMRYGIIAPVVCHMIPEGKTKKEFLEEASDKFYTNPDGKVKSFSKLYILSFFHSKNSSH